VLDRMLAKLDGHGVVAQMRADGVYACTHRALWHRRSGAASTAVGTTISSSLWRPFVLMNSIANTSFMHRLYRLRHHNLQTGVEFMSVAAIPSTPAYSAPSSTTTTAPAAGSSSAISAQAAAAPAASSSAASPAAAAVSSQGPAVPARAADGDYKARNAQSAATKDSDSDYKPRTSYAAAQSSSAVQAALSSLKAGG
jgi:hypothetical protein